MFKNKSAVGFDNKNNLTIWVRSPLINGLYMIALRLVYKYIHIYLYICAKTSALQKLKGVLLHLTAFVVCFGIL